MGKTYRKASGRVEGDTRTGRTRKKPKDLSSCDREECDRREGGGVYDVISKNPRWNFHYPHRFPGIRFFPVDVDSYRR